MNYDDLEKKLSEIIGLMKEKKIYAVLNGTYRLGTIMDHSGREDVALYRNASDDIGLSEEDDQDGAYPYMVKLSRDTVNKPWVEVNWLGNNYCGYYMPMPYDLSFFLSDFYAIKEELKRVYLPYQPFAGETQHPAFMVIPNYITEQDKQMVEALTNMNGTTETLYCKSTGETFEQAYRVISLDGIHVIPLDSVDTKTANQAKKKFAVSAVKVNGSDSYTIHNSNDVTIIPCGKTFKRYVNELRITKIFNDEGNINHCDAVENYLDSLGIKDESDQKAHCANSYLIYHPETLTRVQYNPKEERPFTFETLDTECNADSLAVALIHQFSWAVSACDYPLN